VPHVFPLPFALSGTSICALAYRELWRAVIFYVCTPQPQLQLARPPFKHQRDTATFSKHLRNSSLSFPTYSLRNTTTKLSTHRKTSPLHDRSEGMSTPIATALPSVLLDESKFLAVANPYPPSADLEFHEDRLTLGLWLVCCAGRGVLRAIFYKPSVSAFSYLTSALPNTRIPQSLRISLSR
jgi:hypothetical protein